MNYLSIGFSTRLLDCVEIIFAREPKDKWPHKIFQNSTNLYIIINGVNDRGKEVDREKDAISFRVEMSSLDRDFKTGGVKTMPALTGDLGKIYNRVLGWFKANADKLSKEANGVTESKHITKLKPHIDTFLEKLESNGFENIQSNDGGNITFENPQGSTFDLDIDEEDGTIEAGECISVDTGDPCDFLDTHMTGDNPNIKDFPFDVLKDW